MAAIGVAEMKLGDWVIGTGVCSTCADSVSLVTGNVHLRLLASPTGPEISGIRLSGGKAEFWVVSSLPIDTTRITARSDSATYPVDRAPVKVLVPRLVFVDSLGREISPLPALVLALGAFFALKATGTTVERVVVDNKAAYDRMRAIISRISTGGILKSAVDKIKLYTEHQPIFDRFNITRQLENAFSRQVHLKSGGYIVIDETEALVAIDVNTGRHKGGKDQESTILKVNLEAADEITRQLRLRVGSGAHGERFAEKDAVEVALRIKRRHDFRREVRWNDLVGVDNPAFVADGGLLDQRHRHLLGSENGHGGLEPTSGR